MLEYSKEDNLEPVELGRGRAARTRLIVSTLGGLALVIVLAFNSIGQSEFVRLYFTSVKFTGYYFLTWLTLSALVVVFPLFLAIEYVGYVAKVGVAERRMLLPAEYWRDTVAGSLQACPQFGLKRYAWCALALAVMNAGSSLTWYMSLDLIPVSINSALYRSTMVFVTIFSVIVLRERIGLAKLMALGTLSLGITLIALGKTDSEAGGWHSFANLAGYLFVLASSVLWALYEVFYQRFVGHATPHGILLLSSLMGFWVLLLFWLPLPIFGVWAPSQLPDLMDLHLDLFLLVNMGFSVMYYVVYSFAITLTSPIFVSFSSTLEIPLSVAADYVFQPSSLQWNTWIVVGLLMTMLGVIFSNLQHVLLPQDSMAFWLQLFRLTKPSSPPNGLEESGETSPQIASSDL